MKNKAIFSVYKGSVADYTNHVEIVKRLKSLSAKEVVGKYKGKLELSIMVEIEFVDAIKKIAKHFKQESILFIDEIGTGRLLYLNNDSLEKIGKLTEVSKKTAHESDSFSKVNERYYIFK